MSFCFYTGATSLHQEQQKNFAVHMFPVFFLLLLGIPNLIDFNCTNQLNLKRKIAKRIIKYLESVHSS